MWRAPKNSKGEDCKAVGRNPSVILQTLRQYVSFVRPDSKSIAALISLTVLASLAPLINPVVFRQIVDHAIPDQDIYSLLQLSAVSFGVILFSILLNYLKEVMGAKITQDQTQRLRLTLYRSYTQRSIDSMASVPPGEPVALASHGASEAAALATRVGPQFLQVFVLVSGAGALLFSTGMPLWMLLPMIGVVPFSLLAHYVSRHIERLMSASIDSMGRISTHISEITSPNGALLYRSGVSGQYDQYQFDEKLSLYASLMIRQTKWNSSFGAAMGAYGAVSLSILFFSGGYLAITGSMTTGDVVALATVSPMVINPLIHSSGIRTDAANSLMAFARIVGAAQEDNPAVDHRENTPNRDSGEAGISEGMSIRAVDVSKKYLRSTRDIVIHSASLEIHLDELVSITGPSGSGKTTILKILAGIDREHEGEVFYGGIDVRLIPGQDRKSQMQYVAQDTVLFQDTIAENFLRINPNVTESEMMEVLDDVGLGGTIQSMPDGLMTVVGSEEGGLSGGQCARLSIARSIICNPPFLILDEPFAHLDEDTGFEILHAVRKRARTVILVTHQKIYTSNFDRHMCVDNGLVKEEKLDGGPIQDL